MVCELDGPPIVAEVEAVWIENGIGVNGSCVVNGMEVKGTSLSYKVPRAFGTSNSRG